MIAVLIGLGFISAFGFWAGWLDARRDLRQRAHDGQALAVTRHPAPANPPQRAPGSHRHGPRILTARFFTDGSVLIWDAHGRHVATFEAGGSSPDWDGWLEGMTTDDQH